VFQTSGYAILDPDPSGYIDATRKSSNTGKVTTICAALQMISGRKTVPATCYEVRSATLWD